MFWLKVHVIDVTICFYEHCIIHMQKVYTWDKSLFSRFLANTIESHAFNRLSRKRLRKSKSFEEKRLRKKSSRSLDFQTGFKGKVLRKWEKCLVFACSYHPLHKRAFLQSIRWLQPLLTKRLPRGRSGDNWNADIWGSVGIDPPDKSWVARTVRAQGPNKMNFKSLEMRFEKQENELISVLFIRIFKSINVN